MVAGLGLGSKLIPTPMDYNVGLAGWPARCPSEYTSFHILTFITQSASAIVPTFPLPAPSNTQHLSHNPAANELAKNDLLCEQVGTLRGVSDMLNGGISLDSPAGWNAWPVDLPLYIYHGGEDNICDPVAARRFGENARAKDKKVEILDVSPQLSDSTLTPLRFWSY